MQNPAPLRRENHYVPQFLLRNFALPNSPSEVLEYRLLVEHDSVPQWESRAIKAVAKHRDLYTVAHETGESDALESWLESEFETPAAASVRSVLTGSLLTDKDMRLLSRLFAAQIVRTPAYYTRHKELWAKELEDEMLKMSARVQQDKPQLNLHQNSPVFIPADEGFPLRVRLELVGDKYHMSAQTVTGRKLWMWSIKQALRLGGPASRLQNYRWTILQAPRGTSWILSDNPASAVVVRPDGTRVCSARWDEPEARLMLPLSPRYLLYHRVGFSLRDQYTGAHPLLAQQIRADLADAAHRSVFSHREDTEISEYRKRATSPVAFRRERSEWQSFGAEQSRAERFD